MLYYKVKKEYDNKPRLKYIGNSTIKAKFDGILISNELYTPGERAKLMNNNKCFDIVEIPKSKIYWFFGARFAD